MRQDLFERHELGGGGAVWLGRWPEELLAAGEQGFEELWAMRPAEFPELLIHGRRLKTPRWSRAYGKDYHFSGQTQLASPPTPQLARWLEWCREHVDARHNGILMNWYDGEQGHYIGAHRDSERGLVEGAPLLTLSLGEERIFRLRPYRGKGFEDVRVGHGDVLVLPWETNLAYTHEVPHFARYRSRRISVTVRAFVEG